MSNPWFRFYSAAIRHPKVAKLPDNDFRLWVKLLAVACENDGFIPPLDTLKRVLNTRLDHLLVAVERLISSLLIDRLEVGYTPHNWSKKQYISDTSTLRVTLHRSKRETPPDTEQIRTDTEIRKKEPKKVLSKETDDTDFNLFKTAYPKRAGNADWKAARKAWIAAIKREPPENIINRAFAYSDWCKHTGKFGTEFVKQARSWLNADGWNENYERITPNGKATPHKATIAANKLRAELGLGAHSEGAGHDVSAGDYEINNP